MVGVAAGIRLSEIPELSRRIVPFSGGMLIGIATFWVLPEITERSGWWKALAGMAVGFLLLWIFDRFLHAPQGVAGPLLVAAGIHSFFDGWSLAVSQEEASNGVKTAFLVGIGVHKLPEGLALGVLLLAATGSLWKAGFSALAVQCGMFIGAGIAILLASRLTPAGASELLACAAGVFVFLGYHAMEDPLRERGWTSTVVPALLGAAGAAVLRLIPGI
jgi:zinc transporter ZupT